MFEVHVSHENIVIYSNGLVVLTFHKRGPAHNYIEKNVMTRILKIAVQ